MDSRESLRALSKRLRAGSSMAALCALLTGETLACSLPAAAHPVQEGEEPSCRGEALVRFEINPHEDPTVLADLQRRPHGRRPTLREGGGHARRAGFEPGDAETLAVESTPRQGQQRFRLLGKLAETVVQFILDGIDVVMVRASGQT